MITTVIGVTDTGQQPVGLRRPGGSDALEQQVRPAVDIVSTIVVIVLRLVDADDGVSEAA